MDISEIEFRISGKIEELHETTEYTWEREMLEIMGEGWYE